MSPTLRGYSPGRGESDRAPEHRVLGDHADAPVRQLPFVADPYPAQVAVTRAVADQRRRLRLRRAGGGGARLLRSAGTRPGSRSLGYLLLSRRRRRCRGRARSRGGDPARRLCASSTAEFDDGRLGSRVVAEPVGRGEPDDADGDDQRRDDGRDARGRQDRRDVDRRTRILRGPRLRVMPCSTSCSRRRSTTSNRR